MKETIYSMIEKVQTKDGKGIYYDSLGHWKGLLIFVGRSDYDPFAAGKQHRDFFTCDSTDSDRNLFYGPHKIFAGQAFPWYGKGAYGKKGK